MNLVRFIAGTISRLIGIRFVCVLALCASGCTAGSMKDPPFEVADSAPASNRNGLLATNRSSTGVLFEQMAQIAALSVRS